MGIRHKIQRLSGLSPSISSVWGWIKRFTRFSGILQFRKAMSSYRPLLRRRLFKHRQNYLFQVHTYKASLIPPRFQAISRYLDTLFLPETLVNPEAFTVRPSVLARRALSLSADRIDSYACKIAALALATSDNNHARHSLLQRYFLSIDTATVAVEVPVYLTAEENGRITGDHHGMLGHIDFLQVFDNGVTVLDYKPGATDDTHGLPQVFWYALALSVRTGIHLKDIRCAWFDENDYWIFPAIQGYYAARGEIFSGLA